MKRFLAIGMLFLFVVTTTEFNQLLKLPILIAHFTEHKQLNQQIGFFDFLYMHYAGHDNNDNDQDRDMQLPFKSHHSFVSIDIQPLMPEAPVGALYLIPLTTKGATEYKNPNFKSPYLSFIWQPPKFC